MRYKMEHFTAKVLVGYPGMRSIRFAAPSSQLERRSINPSLMQQSKSSKAYPAKFEPSSKANACAEVYSVLMSAVQDV